ncbi:hypothetical protein QFZ24_000310 [Streptomyces phaeochromogenes]|jgi:hypothetical protein|nr:hypothetical protein [Streptomyces phaeochromogenes]
MKQREKTTSQQHPHTGGLTGKARVLDLLT